MITICNKTNHLFVNYPHDYFKRDSYYRSFIFDWHSLTAGRTYSTDLLRYDFDKGLLEPITVQTGRNKGAKYSTPSTTKISIHNLKICVNPAIMRCSGSVVFPKRYTPEFLSAIVASLKQSQVDLIKREKLLATRINALDLILETNPEYFL